MRSRFGALSVLLLMAGCLRLAAADPQGVHAYITPYGGFMQFDDDLTFRGDGTLIGVRGLGHKLSNDPYYGGRAGLMFNPWFGLEAAGGFVSTDLRDTSDSPRIKFTHLSGNIVLSPYMSDRGGILWTEGMGWGRVKVQGGAKDTDLDQGLLESSLAGILNFTRVVGIRLEARHFLWLPKKSIKDAHIKYWEFGGGLQFNFGGGPPLDTDHDGVPDRRDQCPNTPLGCRVDQRGCPIDSDNDGVCDGIDTCPNTPRGARVDAHGCPIDSDGDGVPDGIDQCEGTPHGCTVDARGCPIDSDNDGVCDGLDQCPNTPAGTHVDEHGCPVVVDSDGDGVPDDRDKCPNTPHGVKVDANGCPIVEQNLETELLDTGRIRLENVHFQTARWDIQPEDTPRLDAVGQVLERWPQLKIEIGGHCDSRGGVEYNHRLSHQRANSVLQYLTHKFPDLKVGQFTVKGYGKDRPLVPNTSAVNMARNRRVEFVVLNRTVLKREVERRRLEHK
ncbi:MAG TPA: OmpA family protein [Candidatus Eisenbacteria bacterium]|nr:OmpA family protein [Candidatus Eisenbacteria bacterium]